MEYLWVVILTVALLFWAALSVYDIIRCTNSLFLRFRDISISTRIFLGVITLLFAFSLVYFIVLRG